MTFVSTRAAADALRPLGVRLFVTDPFLSPDSGLVQQRLDEDCGPVVVWGDGNVRNLNDVWVCRFELMPEDRP